LVGRVIYKNFETGSYEKMRITIYDGVSFSDIEREPILKSYLVNITTGKVVCDFASEDKVINVSLLKINEIVCEAKRFLFDNVHITVAEFVCLVGEIKFRAFSSKCGTYSPPDLRAVYDARINDIYMLCSENSDEDYMTKGVICKFLNQAITEVFGSEDEMFFVSGKGIYINISLFAHSRSALDSLGVREDLKKAIKTKRKKRHMLSFVPSLSCGDELRGQPLNETRYNLISLMRSHMLKICRYVYENAVGLKTKSETARFIFDLADDEYVLSVASDFAQEMSDAALLYRFGFKASSHINYLDADDVLALYAGTEPISKIAERAAAISANMKLRDLLPCPLYYDSYGKAYW